MTNFIKISSLIVSLLFFSGCMPSQHNIKSVFQTNSATTIKKDQERLQSLLSKFKSKLDKRNPKTFSKRYERRIYSLINGTEGKFFLNHNNVTLTNYKDYLQFAFSKDDISLRNDYLILGIYYLIDEAYRLDKQHKVVALEYDKYKIDRLNKNLQIIKCKIKVDRDLKDKYLFLTWQNNWQIELEKKYKSGRDLSLKELEQLTFIKDGKENLLDHSNFSFEVLLTQMIDSTENSLVTLGEEPSELAFKAMFLFL